MDINFDDDDKKDVSDSVKSINTIDTITNICKLVDFIPSEEDIKEIQSAFSEVMSSIIPADKNTDRENIMTLDSKIKKRFTKEIENLASYKLNLKKLTKNYKKEKNISQRSKLRESIAKLIYKIDDLEGEKSLTEYLCLTQNIVSQYLDKMKIPTTIDFVSKKIKYTDNEVDEMLEEYLNLAKKFIGEDEYNRFMTKKSSTSKVKCCENSSISDIDDINTVCSSCGKEFAKFSSVSFSDIDRINVVQTTNYERKVHFKDALNQFQGKQNTYIDSQIFIALDKKFKMSKLLVTGAKSKQERYKNITIHHVRTFLGETHNSKQYENCRLIWHLITGKELLDLSHLEHKLFADFDKLCEAYDSFSFERDNFLNSQFVIYELLYKNGIKLQEDDFHMLKTPDRRASYNNMYEQCCKKLGWTWIPLN